MILSVHSLALLVIRNETREGNVKRGEYVVVLLYINSAPSRFALSSVGIDLHVERGWANVTEIVVKFARS